MLVQVPQMIGYCGQKMFRHIGDGAVYLISKLRTSSDHVELWTYYLYRTLLTNAGALSPFGVMYLDANSEDYVPFARLEWSDGSKAQPVVIRIKVANLKYRLDLTPEGDESQEFWTTQLEKTFHLQKEDDYIFLRASRKEIQPTIGEIVRIARDYAGNTN